MSAPQHKQPPPATFPEDDADGHAVAIGGFVDRLNMENRQLRDVIEKANSYVPEGYQMVMDTLPERVKLMAEGLHVFARDRARMRTELSALADEIQVLHDEIERLNGPLPPSSGLLRAG